MAEDFSNRRKIDMTGDAEGVIVVLIPRDPILNNFHIIYENPLATRDIQRNCVPGIAGMIFVPATL